MTSFTDTDAMNLKVYLVSFDTSELASTDPHSLISRLRSESILSNVSPSYAYQPRCASSQHR